MKTILALTRTVIFSMVMMLIVSGCGKSPKDQLVGTWQENGQTGAIIEFLADGTFTVKPPKEAAGMMGDMNLTGKWLILPDGKLKVDISMGGTSQSQVAKLSFEGGEMVITDENGKATRHKRLK